MKNESNVKNFFPIVVFSSLGKEKLEKEKV